MRPDSPFDALHTSLASACLHDLPDLAYQQLVAGKDGKYDAKNPSYETRTRRYHFDEVEVKMFLQSWGSTALGYGGLGGSAITSAYTVVISHGNYYCVYFGSGGRLAYKLDMSKISQSGRMNFFSDISTGDVKSVADARARYA